MDTPPRPLVGNVRLSTDKKDVGPEVQRTGLLAPTARVEHRHACRRLAPGVDLARMQRDRVAAASAA